MKLVGADRIVGIEQNPESVTEVESAGYEVIQADALELVKLNRRFDGVHCSHILEHLYPEQVHTFLKNMDEVLEPGGIFVVRGPLLSDWFFDDLSHIRPYTPHVFKRYLTADGGGQKSHEALGPYDLVHLYHARLPLLYIRHARGKALWAVKRFFDTLAVRTPIHRIKSDQFVMVFRKQA
jgi:SAM-dependent methyltransferase